MHIVSETITYIFLFAALYVEIFFLITYFESKEISFVKVLINQKSTSTDKLPSVSVIVPVWNEETTVSKTIFSILKLNYPKDKLKILIVDDGSTDNTWKVIQKFSKNKQIKLLKKENGGKHTALNYALEFVATDLVGCLDADSFVHPEALKRMVPQFANSEIMAVTPSIKVFEPKGVLGLIQKAEYMFGIFLRKVLYHLDAIYITPGPFSIFRVEVFKKIGGYRKAHNTEDMEMAMRMQRNGMKIGNAYNAYIYTVIPPNFKSLYKQRLRWVYGFIKNAFDYRDMFFRPKYGNLGMIVLPAAGFSVISTIYFFVMTVSNWLNSVFTSIREFYTAGFYLSKFNLDFFYFDSSVITFVSIIAITGTILIITFSRNLSEEKNKFGLDSVLFMLLYTFIAPIWISKAVYNSIFHKENKWR